MENAERVRKPSMGGTWKCEFRNPKLAHAAEPLHLGCVEQLPCQLIQSVLFVEDYEAVNWIPHAIGSLARHGWVPLANARARRRLPHGCLLQMILPRQALSRT